MRVGTPAPMRAGLVRRSTWLVAAALFAAPAVTWSQDQPPPKRVLMLYGHDPNAPGAVAFTNALHAIVLADSPTRVVFYDELLDLERFPENARRKELVDYIVEKYRGFSFDAILTEGTRALTPCPAARRDARAGARSSALSREGCPRRRLVPLQLPHACHRRAGHDSARRQDAADQGARPHD